MIFMESGKKTIPVGLIWLYAAAFVVLDSTVGVGASFLAGNLSNAAEQSDDQCLYKIYRSASEFRMHQGECVGHAGTLKVTGFLSSSGLKIRTAKEVTKISLDGLWGFQHGDQVYRVLDHRLYHVIDCGPTVIYKGIGKYHLRYYFSQELDDDIYWFSKKNLRQVYSEHQHFLNLVNQVSIHQLLQYDTCARQFLIQKLLAKDDT